MSDVLATIKADHDNVKSLFGKAAAAAKFDIAETLIAEMKAHSATEDVSTLTTPSLISTLPPTSASLGHDAEEHVEINKMLADAAAAPINDAVINKAASTFIAHSKRLCIKDIPFVS
ncbi:hypothetical protein NEOLEDRAFT_1179495 [Neolentinus lepideus HHB14362 ss-1]|uniref:Hemerythrin-like domain-containing protein n=1 Tax=Neolentinus lepideus HHB14362 ss-1 TaxID=1314782 RepID=A0A165RTH5_9AGAM|nr:hypothetical protein NEOLEDRAFT_1179495 [Neolentinus lepideus HHB14362 ss-1]